MTRRPALLLAALGLVAPFLASVVGPAVAAPGDLTVRVSRVFSPNGDGRQDQARVRYDLPVSARVKIVVLQGTPGKTMRIVRLGRHQRGSYEWRWDGRGRGGARLDQGTYYVNVTVEPTSGSPTEVRRVRTRIDTTVAAFVEPRANYSLPEGRALPVYPRTRVVRDSVSLRPIFAERLRWARMVVMDGRGRAVLTRDVSDARDFTYTNTDYGQAHPDDVVWTARRAGKALPPGRYRAFIRARDAAGNIQRSAAYPVWVSREALEWRRETRVVTASESRTGVCGFLSTANGCGEQPRDCGEVVPSALLVDGLSYRSAVCDATLPDRNRAWSLHYLAVPETTGVRGVGAAKVAFTGRPTVDGETDPGTLALWQDDFGLDDAVATGSTAGETAWVECPRTCRGMDNSIEVFDPGVVWTFTTTGTDSVDVGTFTIALRYLAVPD